MAESVAFAVDMDVDCAGERENSAVHPGTTPRIRKGWLRESANVLTSKRHMLQKGLANDGSAGNEDMGRRGLEQLAFDPLEELVGELLVIGKGAEGGSVSSTGCCR
jgi:hypothetical protein